MVRYPTTRESIYPIIQFSSPKVVFGINSSQKIGEEIKSLGRSKPLIVSDKGVIKAGIVERVRTYLKRAGFTAIGIYDETLSEPTLESMEDAKEYIRKNDYDVVIGVGGGSSLDTAKIMAVMKLSEGNVFDYLEKRSFKGWLPLVLIPTTAGTGSEVTQYIVISVDDKKTTIADPKFSADLALLDPTFTLSMPPKITAGTGIDALSHAIEGMMTIFSNELTNLLATKAVGLIWNNIEKAYHRGEDLQARSNLMLASTLAGIVIRNAKTTIGHWVAYSIAHDYKLPHGVSCGIPLPYAMQYNLPACKELFANMALIIELGTRETGKKELALRFIREIRDLIKRVGLPTSLQEIGVPKERLEKLAKGFVADHPYPRNICDMDLERALMFYEWTWKGELEGIDI